ETGTSSTSVDTLSLHGALPIFGGTCPGGGLDLGLTVPGTRGGPRPSANCGQPARTPERGRRTRRSGRRPVRDEAGNREAPSAGGSAGREAQWAGRDIGPVGMSDSVGAS